MTSVKQRMLASERLVGLMTPLPNPMIVEIAGQSGVDFLVLDTEHGPAESTIVHLHIALARSLGMEAWVRVHGAAEQEASRYLDLGATGVMVAGVDSPDVARAIVRHLRFPPLGQRGFALGSHAGGFGASTAADLLASADRETVIIAMIESEAGVASAQEIAGVDGIDGLFLGRADLAVSQGVDISASTIVEAASLVKSAAAAAGKVTLEPGSTANPPRLALYNAASIVTMALRELSSRP